MAPRPTLLVFTLGPSREARRRRLLPAPWETWERALQTDLLERTLEAGRACGARLAVSSPEPVAVGGAIRLKQRAGSFGSRLVGAMDAARHLGSGPLVVVGTDTPELDGAAVGAALRELERHPEAVVLGPAPDGGIYLLASCRPLAGILEGVAWRTGRARATLEARLAQAGIPVFRLRPLRDLDRPTDLARWLRSASVESSWVRILRRLLVGIGRPLVALRVRCAVGGHCPPAPGRAPPFAPA